MYFLPAIAASSARSCPSPSRYFRNKIQEYYSIRCVPQILGPIADALRHAARVTEEELNSANDNPVVIPGEGNVYHGGNFHGDYISFEMDKVKIAIGKLTVLCDRQLNFLLNQKLNRKFPPFLNAGKLGLNYGLQGLQFTATSTTAENQALCNSMYVHSIPSNNDNQDVVSMGTNSALFAKRVIDNAFEVMAVLLIGVAQAIDLLPLDEKERLSPSALEMHGMIRERTTFITEDISQAGSIQSLAHALKEKIIA